VYTIDLAWKVLALARQFGGLDDCALERLDEIRAELETYRQPGLTEKNRAVIRQVLVEDVWRSVLSVPDVLLVQPSARARVLRFVQPSWPAWRSQQDPDLRPIRVGNLARIRIGENLIRRVVRTGRYWLVFPEYEVKNRVALEFELDDETTAIIDRYLQAFRPVLLRGAVTDWLFPGEDGAPKGATTLSQQISDRVFDATGVRITAHQFRHGAAAILLRGRPGEYELVRRLLGHSSITTTTRFYAGLESLRRRACLAGSSRPSSNGSSTRAGPVPSSGGRRDERRPASADRPLDPCRRMA
jgi:hypothetical protein